MKTRLPACFTIVALALASLFLQSSANAKDMKKYNTAKADADQQWKLDQTRKNLQNNKPAPKPAPAQSWAGSGGVSGTIVPPAAAAPDNLSGATVRLYNWNTGRGGNATVSLNGNSSHTLSGSWRPGSADFTVSLNVGGASGTLTMNGNSFGRLSLRGGGVNVR